MSVTYEVDIDSEKVHYDGEWLGRQALADKIKRMIDSQDFRIGTAGQALEYLQQVLANARSIEVKLAPEDADLLDRHARQADLSPSALARQAIQAYLAAQPPVEDQQARPAAITTEPVAPEEEQQAVELTRQKSQSSSKVLVDPSLQDTQEHEDRDPAADWFKQGN